MKNNTYNQAETIIIHQRVKDDLEFFLSDFFHFEKVYNGFEDFYTDFSLKTKLGFELQGKEFVINKIIDDSIVLKEQIKETLVRIKTIKKIYFLEISQENYSDIIGVNATIFNIKKDMSINSFFELSYNHVDLYEIKIEQLLQKINKIIIKIKEL